MLVEEALALDPKARPDDGAVFAERLDFWLGLQPTRPHDSDLSAYFAAVTASAAESFEEKWTKSVPLAAHQATPSDSLVFATPRAFPRPWLLALAAMILFAASLGLGWLTSRLVFRANGKHPAASNLTTPGGQGRDK
jgi:hypothetical protein